MKVKGICTLLAFVATLSCSDRTSPRVEHIPVKYEAEQMPHNQEHGLREAAETQLPEGITIVQLFLAGETDGQTAMVFWMHQPGSYSEKTKVSYFDKNEFGWAIRD